MNASISVVGGTYSEECAFPRRRVLRGSGGRAAAFLSSLKVQTTLHTVVANDQLIFANSLAKKLGYQLRPTISTQTVSFRYRFPLGKPEIYPSSVAKVAQPLVIAERALVYGMMEGRPKVTAKKAVYDPQDGSNSRPFSENGSVAESLAQIVSWSEGRALTGVDEPEDIARELLSQDSTVVAIVKCGPQGALVSTKDNQSWIHSFPTQYVYKIGSGDIFSAAFAYRWMCFDDNPISAAWFASRCVALYVEQGTDRLSDQQCQILTEANNKKMPHKSGNRRHIPSGQIYLAAPFFNVGQQWVVDETRSALQDMGFNVFSPIHDIGEGLANDIASADLEALRNSSVMLAILDGLDPGTLFEVGYARAIDIPVVAVTEDVPASALTMVEGSGCDVVPDLTTAIYRACWTLMGDV